jgi:hypothetical protein
MGMVITCDFSGKARKTTGPADVIVLRESFGHDAVRYAAKGNIRMRQRQILLNGLFAHRNILINSKKCPKLTRDVKKVTQKEDFTKDKSNPKLTHTSDTMDYYADQEYESGTSERFKDYKAR